jgi:hypothetical protein
MANNPIFIFSPAAPFSQEISVIARIMPKKRGVRRDAFWRITSKQLDIDVFRVPE